MDISGKKILMVVNYEKNDRSVGITKKIEGEIQTLRAMGARVVYSAYESNGVCIWNEYDELLWHRPWSIKNSYYIKKFRRFELIKTINDFLKLKKETFDIGYLRYLGFDGSFIKILKKMKQQKMVILLESLSWVPGTKIWGRSLGWAYIGIFTILNGKKAGKYLDLVLEEGSYETMFGCKAIPFGNGVVVDNYEKHRYLGQSNALNLISVANETVYHGYDRLIYSIYCYYKNPRDYSVKLYLVGEISDKTKDLVKKLKLENQVVLCGKNHGEELDNIYKKCNMAVGPLGQHRVGGKKDTGLKTKEYFARGIPYFYAGEERLIPPNYPFVMEVPSDESSIDFEQVFCFWKQVEKIQNHAEQMRKFAKENYSWKKIMKDVFEEVS
ncbi:hypothetical protein [Allofournierella sp.]|uniref:hypothetical protein n=1 Tax=Allofournierella sp. TaxID=1940256 RepID=UPI003AB30D77